MCDEASDALSEVAERHGVTWSSRNILEDEDAFAKYRYRVPVVVVNGIERLELRFSEAQLEDVLTDSKAEHGVSEEPHHLAAFRQVPRTGVIFVTTEAQRAGYSPRLSSWCNLGQGQPETGPLPGAPPRVHSIAVDVDDQEYAPVAGLTELREAIAQLYNRLYRKGKRSQYGPENVSVSGGGRASLTRAAAALGPINLGHFLPDYTAYEELLDIFKAFTPIPILLEGEHAYAFSVDDLRREILGRGLGAILMSNPCNPTGKVVQGTELRKWVDLCRELECALLVDEFYSHYIWNSPPGVLPVESAARYVDDVNADPVVIFDGLTKNWRYPGWRVTWTLGPKQVIDAVASAGSFLDGGGNKPAQRAAIPLLEEAKVIQETNALHRVFQEKRDRLLSGLLRLGVRVDRVPDGTFYVWGNVAQLPPPLNDGMGFFRAALEQKVITVPGEFFDVNPGKRRAARGSRFRNYVRFSFGPPSTTLETALVRLETLVSQG
jgi:aspartate/methionine/tyrosine aminotransferase